MQTYKAQITETLKKILEAEANSREETKTAANT